MAQERRQKGFSLLELLAVTVLLGVLATIILVRVTGQSDEAKIAACQVYKGDIEIQSELWIHNTGAWPASNLAIIGADTAYFPEGLPVCPLDGSAYTINTVTGRVIGHNH